MRHGAIYLRIWQIITWTKSIQKLTGSKKYRALFCQEVMSRLELWFTIQLNNLIVLIKLFYNRLSWIKNENDTLISFSLSLGKSWRKTWFNPYHLRNWAATRWYHSNSIDKSKGWQVAPSGQTGNRGFKRGVFHCESKLPRKSKTSDGLFNSIRRWYHCQFW